MEVAIIGSGAAGACAIPFTVGRTCVDWNRSGKQRYGMDCERTGYDPDDDDDDYGYGNTDDDDDDPDDDDDGDFDD